MNEVRIEALSEADREVARKTLNGFRGLDEAVLGELIRLDEGAIAAGCRFSEERRALVQQRRDVIRLRVELGLNKFQSLPRKRST